MVHVVELLTRNWQQSWPSVLISLPPSEPASPSAPAARMDTTDRLNLRQGLLKGVVTTKAWILTDGADAGTTRLIGRMMGSTDSARDLVCIGINSWERMVTTDQMAGSRPNGHVFTYYTNGHTTSNKEGSGGGSGKNMASTEPCSPHFPLSPRRSDKGGSEENVAGGTAPSLQRTSSSVPNAAPSNGSHQVAEHRLPLVTHSRYTHGHAARVPPATSYSPQALTTTRYFRHSNRARTVFELRSICGRQVAIEPNHSHFLFIDEPVDKSRAHAPSEPAGHT